MEKHLPTITVGSSWEGESKYVEGVPEEFLEEEDFKGLGVSILSTRLKMTS